MCGFFIDHQSKEMLDNERKLYQCNVTLSGDL